MLSRRTVILCGIETTYGTDPALTSAANAVLAWDVTPDFKGEVLKRDILRDSLSPAPHVIGMKEATITFKTELKGKGQATTPELDTLLVGCGFGTATHSGTADIIYNLKSDEADVKSVSFYVYMDGNMHKITGARGNVKFNLEAGKYGIAEFEFSGLYNAVSAATLPDISGLSNYLPPIVYNSSFQIGGFSPVCSKANIDIGNKVVRRDDLNAAYGVNSFRISNREPKLEFTPDAVVESSNPFWGNWSSGIVSTYSVNVGSTDGNIVQLSGYFEYETLKYADENDIRTYQCTASLVSSDVNTQNDELVVTFS